MTMGGSQPLDLTVLDQIPVAPPPESTPELTLPLTFLDILWLHMSPVHRLIFYQHPVSTTHFLHTLLPILQTSLSQTLRHYSPLAGRLMVSPDNSVLPEIRYAHGDTVPLLIAESKSSGDVFDHLVSDGVRSCSVFHPLVPSLPPASDGGGSAVSVPVLALQVTLFPDVGICIGVTNHHVIGDGSSIFRFMEAWAFLSSSGRGVDQNALPSRFLPFYDRTAIQDRKGLGKIFWDYLKNIKIKDTHVHRLPSIADKVRGTFRVSPDQIKRLKNQVLTRRPDLVHVSTFTVICSYVWNCLVRSRHAENEDEEDEFFGCVADCRARLDPPVPENYFGNCLTACYGYAKVRELVSEGGLAAAAAVVGGSIRRQLYNEEKDGVFKGGEDWFSLFTKLNPDRALGVAGSPKFDYYGLDFGWGKGKKFEMPSIDITGAISLSGDRDVEGGLEVGLALPVTQMHTFSKIFAAGLEALYD
ncbi:unnamed protein product [Cuscuta campestris]|uniref:Uncharacterized protein n=1 Tax=Cuscuta campestris TaxID=132261 RepID=A0A484N0B1_9ASTE|nr:unnamed protein product [Cuscuta campestris]